MKDPYDEFHVAHPLYLKGVEQERQRIMPIARAAHPAIHNESPRPMCPVCIMITRIDPQQ